MFNLEKYPWIVPVLLVFIGAGWLMNTLDMFPGVNWAYVLGVAAVGLVILMQGINKLSFVVGTFLLLGSVAAFLRQRQIVKLDVEVPFMVIILGILLLIAQYAGLPNPPTSGEERSSDSAKKLRLPGGQPPVA